ncbi:MAG: N-acetylmuramoyl-L-alanine amidase [Gemmatimonadota bacterium]
MILAILVSAALQAPPPQARPPQRRPAPKPVARVVAPAAKPKAFGRVVVDAGHGGVDPGAPMQTKAGLREKDITLQLALRLGEALKLRGIEVVFTRKKDTLIALADRGRIANQAGGDVFISIHVNAANKHWRNPGAARGFETYFLAEAKTEDARRVEAMENEALRFEGPRHIDSSDPLGFILKDMEQNQYLRESSEFAGIVQRRLAQVHPGPDRGVKQAGFHVLVTALMPAILVEVGFGTNSGEAAYLSSTVRQQALARVIADATNEYLDRYQRRVGNSGLTGSHD